MSLLTLWATSLGLFSLVNFLLLPLAARYLRSDPTISAIKKAATVSTFDFLRTLSLLGVVVYGVLLLLVAWINAQGGTTVETILAARNRIDEATASFKVLTKSVTVLLFSVSFIALLFFSRRWARGRVEQEFRQCLIDEVSRLQEARVAGGWEKLPPTPAMAELLQELSSVETKLHVIAEGEGPYYEQQRAAFSEYAEKLRMAIENLDLRRRIHLTWDPAVVDAPNVKGLWARLKIFFVSRGAVLGLKGIKRVCYNCGLALLLVSLIGIGRGNVQTAAESQRTYLRDLHVELSRADAKASYEALTIAPVNADSTSALDDHDEAVLDSLSRLFETSFLQDPELGGSVTRSTAHALRQLRVRQAILERGFSRSPRAGQVTLSGAISEADGLAYLERAGLKALNKDVAGHGPVTSIGREFRNRLRRDIALRRPAVWASIKSAARKGRTEFETPLQLGDVRKAVVGEVIGNIAGDVPFDNALQELAIDLAKHPASESMVEAFEARYQQFVTDVAVGDGLHAARVRVSGADPKVAAYKTTDAATLKKIMSDCPDEARIVEKLSIQRPRVQTPWHASADVKMADKLVDRVYALRGGPGRASELTATDALISYGDIFPGELGEETRSARGLKLIERDPINYRKVSPGHLIRSIEQDAPDLRQTLAAAERSAAQMKRAFNFRSLRGFSRVGGVLIGQDSEQHLEGAHAFIGFEWTSAGANLQFKLKRADGAVRTLGPYRKSIVNSALLYAADGRPTAVTIINTDPIPDRRILLHPVLEDTPIGCRMIDFDQLVFRFIGERGQGARNEECRKAMELVYAANALYELAWYYRANALGDSVIALMRDLDAPQIRLLSDHVRTVERNIDSLAELAELAYETPEAIADSTRTPLRAKREFYDQSLVDIIAAHVRTSTSLSDLQTRVSREAQIALKRGSELLDGSRWLSIPPSFSVVSGARELTFRVDDKLDFLRRELFTDPLYPFDFMLQVSFSSQPSFLQRASPQQGNAQELYIDDRPWEFPFVRKLVRKTVADSLSVASPERQLFIDMSEFTVVQRLFRTALAGALGDEFPIERLAELAEETSAFADTMRTPRWDCTGHGDLNVAEELELLIEFAGADSTFQAGDDAWAKQFVASARACHRQLRASLKAGDRLSSPRWSKLFEFALVENRAAAACSTAAAQHAPGQLPCLIMLTAAQWKEYCAVRELGNSLGLGSDYLLLAKNRACPSLR